MEMKKAADGPRGPKCYTEDLSIFVYCFWYEKKLFSPKICFLDVSCQGDSDKKLFSIGPCIPRTFVNLSLDPDTPGSITIFLNFQICWNFYKRALLWANTNDMPITFVDNL